MGDDLRSVLLDEHEVEQGLALEQLGGRHGSPWIGIVPLVFL